MGNAVIRRAEMQDWLKWKAAVDSYWIKVGVVAAAGLAALFSLFALLK
jgi:hypothetical protein